MMSVELLDYAAKRSTTEPGLLGQVFSIYQSLEDCTRDALAEELGCDEQTLNRLSLCRKPTGDVFAEQVKKLCLRFDLEPFALVNVLRQVEIMGSDVISGAAEHAPVLQLAALDKRKKDEPGS
ncbi:hypothetical protein [Corallococcus exiguus]|uniref:hypothetical protein n=2 Tax=Corallococcus exiguus TaxID=83462 RepID=UPI00155FEFA4|nr:hypothetical protein [Corallococcus exiguus]NRD46781.1 hypothetical protein [Corallococcus exiguus]